MLHTKSTANQNNLVVCDVFTFRGGLFTFSGLDLYIFFRSLFAHINA